MNQGDYAVGSLIDFKFATRDSGGAPTSLAGTPALGVYKANSTTESTVGVTLITDFDLLTGLNHVRINTSADDTFYSAGNNFDVIITAGTVGGISVVGQVVGSFSLENRSALRPATVDRTLAIATDGGVILADNVAHGGPPSTSTATLALKRAQVANDGPEPGIGVTSAGNAIQGYSTDNGSGGYFSGSGSYPGVWALGGSLGGPGVLFEGGSLAGPGLKLRGRQRPGMEVSTNGASTIYLSANGGDGILIEAYDVGTHDINLNGSHDILGNLNGNVLGTVIPADGSINSAKFTVGSIMGPATGILEQTRQVWRSVFKKSTKTSTQIKTFADDDTTVLTTQPISSVSGTDTRGSAT